MFKSLITLFFIISITTLANAQRDTTFYYLSQSGNYLQKKDSAYCIRAVVKPAGNEKNFIVHDYYLNGKDKFIGHAQKPNGLIFEGYCIEFYPNGNKKSDEFFVNNLLNGPVTTYYPNGKLYMTGKFDMGIVINQCRDTLGRILAENGAGEVIDFNDDFSMIMDRGGIKGGLRTGKWMFMSKDTLKYLITYEQGRPIHYAGIDNIGNEHPFYGFNEAPTYAKGVDRLYSFIKAKSHYTDEAKKANISGTVHLTFIVETDGKLTDIAVTEGLGYGLDEEAIRVIKLTSSLWIPAREYGVPVRRRFDMPVNFGLNTLNSSYKLNH